MFYEPNNKSEFSEEIKNLNQKIDSYIGEHGFSGAMRLTIKGKVIYERSVGYADAERKIPFSDSSMFTLYSLSKPFCAIGLMKLVDAGRVDLNKHPSVYVPEAKGFDKDLRIHHLLNHTSGIADFVRTEAFYKKYEGSRNADIRFLLEKLSTYPSTFKPGTDGFYTNVNFVIAALIIENVSGKKYADYMKEEVFMPLGLKSAVVDYPGLYIPDRVVGYEKDVDGKTVPVEKEYFSMMGGGDIVATVDDVYCLNLAIKNKALLSESALERILTPSPFNSMGFGCNVSTWHGKTRIQHNGGSVGFRTLHVHLKEDDFDLILLSNSAYSDARYIFLDYAYDSFYHNLEKESLVIEMDKGYI